MCAAASAPTTYDRIGGRQVLEAESANRLVLVTGVPRPAAPFLAFKASRGAKSAFACERPRISWRASVRLVLNCGSATLYNSRIASVINPLGGNRLTDISRHAGDGMTGSLI